ncbi:hypothetical protein NP233_g926 [Leucocoprinus birnbaumii]|uniref:Uncharacterized protein n=1 Tax=Leucocoprinus birnbaumii TaxID=56174 RepID=A0AAD5W3R9_9AGAR|nr:hypothetical protein NP233_g926 [Leucocoprinus birnbaumii]
MLERPLDIFVVKFEWGIVFEKDFDRVMEELRRHLGGKFVPKVVRWAASIAAIVSAFHSIPLSAEFKFAEVR